LLHSFFWVIFGVRIFCADVSEQSVCSIFTGRLNKLLFKRPIKMGQIVSKRRHTNFRGQGITQKTEYNIHIMTKVRNYEFFTVHKKMFENLTLPQWPLQLVREDRVLFV